MYERKAGGTAGSQWAQHWRVQHSGGGMRGVVPLTADQHPRLMPRPSGLRLLPPLSLTRPASLELGQGRRLGEVLPVWRGRKLHLHHRPDQRRHPRSPEPGPRDQGPVRPPRKRPGLAQQPVAGGGVRVHHQGPGRERQRSHLP